MLRISQIKCWLVILALMLEAALAAPAAKADFFVTNWNTGTVGEYTNSGGTVNAQLVSNLVEPSGITVTGPNVLVMNYGTGIVGQYVLSSPGVLSSSSPNLITNLQAPRGIAASGSTFYVSSYTNSSNGTVGRYTLGATPGSLASSSPSFITGLTGGPNGIAVSSSNIFVQNSTSGTVSEYDLTGTLVNSTLISVTGCQSIALSGSNLYVASENGGNFTIGQYTLGSAPGTILSSIPSLITAAGGPMAISVYGGDIYMASYVGNAVVEYNTSGILVSSSLVGPLGGSVGIYATPEPSSLLLVGIGVGGLLIRRRRSA